MPDTAAVTAPVPPEPLVVLQTFVDAGVRGDVQVMKSCLTRGTLESGQFNGEQPKGVRFTFGEAAWEGDAVVIPMTGTPEDPAAAGMPPMQMQCVMLQEDGAWKFDLNATMEKMFGGSMETAMEQVAGAMKEALGGAMEGIGNAMSEAFGTFGSEEEAPPDWSAASQTPTPEELLPMPELEPLPKLAARISEAVGFPVAARAAMKDLLGGLGSTEHDGLITWMEDSLFAAWGQLFAEAAQVIPLQGRLRGVRIEGATNWENRLLIVDGNDLVYRVYFNVNDGYFSDQEIQTRLAGVLASLPDEMQAETADARLVPQDEENVPLEAYRERVVPRVMQRVSALVGRQVALRVDWDRVDDPWRGGRQLPRWMLNRVYGALVLASGDEALRGELSANLKEIKIEFVVSHHYKFAKYADGVFTVGMWWWEGERGFFYDYELVPAFRGEKVGEEWVEEPVPDVSEEAMNSAPAEPAAEFSSDVTMTSQPQKAKPRAAKKKVAKKTVKKPAAKPAKKPAIKKPAAKMPAPKKHAAKKAATKKPAAKKKPATKTSKGGKKNGLRRRRA